ncbi:hypothetical protein [Serratia oryzae]|uniref:hypothetical protein n=1 Tax=Serratia oryzae TaxID=2034155 RepID=UPI0012E31707|nr:hypothetical protein [Serratia oryzae]
MIPIKVKAIIAAIITIIIVVLFWLYLPKEKADEALPRGNTIYVQSNSPGECRAVISTILDGKKPAPSEIPCKVQLQSKK